MLLLPLLACESTLGTPSTPADSDAPTWYGDVAPIVEARCSSCHQPGGVGFDLTDPAASVAMANAIASAVETRRMPPWGAYETDTCTPTRAWVDDRRLTDEEIATVVAWADADAPLGDGSGAISPRGGEELTGPLLEATPPGAYRSVGAEDEFACFIADPGNEEDAWADALLVVPSNDAIAHHALVYRAPAADTDALGAEDGWYDCSGGINVAGATFLATWVPGSGPTYAPAGAGIRIPAGERFIVQMHYHPGGESGAVDEPAVVVQLLDEPPAQELHSTLIGNYWREEQGLLPGPNESSVEFKIPAGTSGHTEEMLTTFPGNFSNLPLAYVGAHMHLVATGMEVWIERARPDADEPESECLLPASRYAYDWQQLYRYEGALADMPAVSGGDSLRIRCTYDNTLENEGTRRALGYAGLDEPVDVYLGEGTLDEMCIAMVGYVY